MTRQIVLFLSALFSLSAASFAEEPAREPKREPLMVNQILIDPSDPKILYAAARPEGFLKSVDRGKSWSPARTGIKNTSGYHLVIDPSNPPTLYLATFGGGVYKSVNGGDSWVEMNDGLGNTNIHALAIDPNDRQTVVVGTSTGDLFQSRDGGSHWAPFGQGLPSIDAEEVIATLLFNSTRPSRLFLGQGGLYTREKGSAWVSAGEGLKKETITALAFDPAEKRLYAGTKKEGLFISVDEGKSWKPFGDAFRKDWINKIFIVRSNELYASVYAKGFFRTSDQGKTWRKVEGGLPSDDVMSLAVDPRDPSRLYAGTHNKGIFISADGGASWIAPDVQQEPIEVIIDSLVPSGSFSAAPLPKIPPAFNKCAMCHGWADLYLTQKKTFWRVPPNRRDWRPTVKRMASGTGLTPAEEEIVIRFLTDYSRIKTP